jgi:hypothetical protein
METKTGYKKVVVDEKQFKPNLWQVIIIIIKCMERIKKIQAAFRTKV